MSRPNPDRPSPQPEWFTARRRYEVTDTGYETPCWIWTMSKDGPYGQMAFRATRGGQTWNVRAHIVYWEHHHGQRVPAGLELDHLCRQTLCVRPDHLEPVTPKVNSRRRPDTNLTIDVARAIRASSDSAAATGRRFGVTDSTVCGIRLGRFWVEDEQAGPDGRSMLS